MLIRALVSATTGGCYFVGLFFSLLVSCSSVVFVGFFCWFLLFDGANPGFTGFLFFCAPCSGWEKWWLPPFGTEKKKGRKGKEKMKKKKKKKDL